MNKPQLLFGKPEAQKIKDEIIKGLESCQSRTSRRPGLAVILVGDNQASRTYVASKEKFAKECGFETFNRSLGEKAGQEELLRTIAELNQDSQVDGILLQLPLPEGYDSNQALLAIDSRKDVDGLHPVNQGLLLIGAEGLRPCTPKGCMRLILQALGSPDKDLSGMLAVVIGRSGLVGKPLALMLLEKNATVTLAHSKTKNLKDVAKTADILISATGILGLVTKEFVKPGAIVIDVGINRDTSGKIAGDCVFEEVSEVCSAITPVPGGVGPLTVAMLMSNTFEAYEKNVK